MSLASAPLPTDPDALRAFAAGLQAELARKDIEIAANAAEIHAKTLHIEKLKAQLAVLRRARFGRSSEKLDRDIEQLELLIGELEEEAAEGGARSDAADPTRQPQVRARERKQPVRRPLPPHLPRETVTHEPPCTCPGCGGTVFSQVGQDEREVLEYVPSSFKVIRHVRPKLSCRACETIVQEPVPALPIERGRPGPGLIAHVLVSKYCDHLPLHRQAVIYDREGVDLYAPTTPAGDTPLVEVSCWSHARRKFYDVHHATASPIALEALQRIAALFAIESGIKGQAPERRAAARQDHARPLLDELKAFLDASLARISGKSTLAGAIRYTLSRWTSLSRYTTDGRLEMSNNAAERAMKPPVLGRKNYLFCGSDAGGQRAACLYTILETAKMNGINPQAYLTDILGRIADHPIHQINALLPWFWTQ